jgi:hypothetical protein
MPTNFCSRIDIYYNFELYSLNCIEHVIVLLSIENNDRVTMKLKKLGDLVIA